MIQKNLIFLALAAVLLIGLFFFIKSSTSTGQAPSPTGTIQETTSSSPQIALPANVFELVIENKKLVSESETISVKKGDEVTIRITADETEEFHIHGLDISVDLTSGQPAELKFIADKTGRFEFELEHSKTELGALEVTP